ncbi:substrate-binding domain-containing protein [Bacteroides sp. OttesenSCG-928-D19]|nr:substrate-binding domain-containing protein [Bacteroides sp. OttesenSCG-928-D19]
MRKIIFLVFCLNIIFYSCTTEEKKYKIGVSQGSDDHWAAYSRKEMEREARLYRHIDIEIRTSNIDTEEQIRDIEYFIGKQVDVLLISPNDRTELINVVSKAHEAGIYVILYDGKIDSYDYTTFVYTNNFEIGYEAGKYISKLLNGRGNIIEVRSWGKITAEGERHSGFMQAVSEYPDINVIAEIYGDFKKETAYQLMNDFIKNQTQPVDLVFAMNDEMAIAVADAYKANHMKRPYIVGVDAIPDEGGGVEAIKQGKIDASFIHATGGDKMIDLAVKILSGEQVEKKIAVNTAVVDQSNVNMLQMQNDLITEQQEKVERINRILNTTLIQYSNQQTVFYGILVLLALIVLMFIAIVVAYRKMRRANKLLEEQKNQVIQLSTKLEEATNAKLTFFTNISHEFKTPLTLILGPVQALIKNGRLTGEDSFLLGLIKRNSIVLQNLISQTIRFKSYEDGKMNATFVRDDMKLFLEELNHPFADYGKRKQIEFHFQTHVQSLPMWFDKENMEKIYFNLLSNAFKHAGSNITITLREETINNKQYARISIHNDGTEIPADKIDKLFNYFYKVNPTDTGTGIGLAFTKVLVDIHHGQIDVESSAGNGTTFHITLPVEQEGEKSEKDEYTVGYIERQLAAETLVESTDPLSNKVDEDKPLLLIIEDSSDIRNFVRTMLEKDYSIIEAPDGNAGIEKAAKNIPDIIICDVLMPGKDGFEVCRILKDNIMTSHIPVIMLTACSLDEQKATGFECGADAYISKPFNIELLEIRIRKLIENRKNLKEKFSNSLSDNSKETTLASIEQEFLSKFENYIEENISNSELGITELTAAMGMSRAQLYRKIKSLTNYSPTDLMRIIRLKYAAHQILHGIQITEASYNSGFSSPSYFTKSFREFYNMSPSEYVKAHRPS